MMTTQLDDILYVDVAVRLESLQEDLFQISQAISPTVRREEVTFEELQGGYVNSIVKLTGLEVSPGVKKTLLFRTFDSKFNADGFMKLYAKPDTNAENGAIGKANGTTNRKANGVEAAKGVNEKDDKTNGVNGEDRKANGEEAAKGKPTVFNRLTEYMIMQEISNRGLCEPVYARYSNGICYGFAEGTTLTGSLMNSEEYLQEAASKFARFHSIKYQISNLPNFPFKARHDRITDELQENFYENLLRIEARIADKNDGPFLELPKLRTLVEYEKRINATLKQIGRGKIGFCHNDPNQKNLIWNSQATLGAKLSFIDLELTAPNYVILDLAYNWQSFCGHFFVDVDGSHFPSSDYRRRFLRRYLQEFNKAEQIELSEEEFNGQLEDLFHRTSLAAVGHLLKWCIFAHVFEVEKDLLKNAESIAAREKDTHFCGKYALGLYRTFSKLYLQVLEDAIEHFEKKSSSSE